MALVVTSEQLVCVKSAIFSKKGERLSDVRGSRGAVTCIASARVSGSDLIVSGSSEGAVQIWSARDGCLIRSLAGHCGPVHCAVALPGAVVVTGGEDGRAKTWRLDDGALLRDFDGHAGPVACAASIEHCRAGFVATGSRDGGLCFWRLVPGTAPEAQVAGHSAEVTCVCEVPGAKIVATGALDGSLRIWRPASGELLHDLEASRRRGDGVCCLAVAGNDLFVVGLASGAVRVFSAARGEMLQECSGHKINVTCAAAVPGTDLVVTASVVGNPKVWNVGNGKLVSELKGQKSCVTHMAAIPDSSFVVALSSDGAATIFDAVSGKVLHHLDTRKRENTDIATDSSRDESVKGQLQTLGEEILRRCCLQETGGEEESAPLLPTLIGRPLPRMFGKSRKAQD